jgi:ribosomal protein S12 methylthiotransferase accessory factor YcaO
VTVTSTLGVDQLLADLLSLSLAPEGFEIPFFTDEPKYPGYFIPMPAVGPYTSGQPYGMSLAADKQEAHAKALAEYYERLCLYHPRPTATSSAWTEDSGWVDPVSLVGPVDRQRARQLRKGPYSWLDATEINTGRKTKIPAQAVVPGFGLEETRILPAVGSSGASLGRVGESGRLEHGLFEVLERYTVGALTFEERASRRVVSLPPEHQQIERDLRRYRLEPHVYWLTGRYEAPWVLVALTDHSGAGPALSFATRSAPTFAEAIYSALLESMERRRPARMEEAGRETGSDTPRVYPWETLETLAEIEPILKSAAPTSFDELPKTPRTAKQLLECFAADGLDVLSVDTTLPEVAAAGFETSKIVIPGLGPMPA